MTTHDPFTIVEIAGTFAVAYREAWRRDLGAMWHAMEGANWIADGPFATLAEAQAARQRLLPRSDADSDRSGGLDDDRKRRIPSEYIEAVIQMESSEYFPAIERRFRAPTFVEYLFYSAEDAAIFDILTWPFRDVWS